MFQVNAKNIFLTYSQVQDVDAFCGTGTQHLEFITDLLGPPVVYRLAKERHADGGIHFHCYCGWDDPVRAAGERIFDFGGVHPNYQGVRFPR